MSERWLGVVVSGDKVTAVDVEVPNDDGPMVLQADHSWPLQKGDRISAYVVMSQQVSNYATENDIQRAIVKESAVSLGGTKKTHLLSAELRGLVITALASVTSVECKSKATISRTFGERTVDEYVADNKFWQEHINGDLRAGSREAAMVLLAARKAQ